MHLYSGGQMKLRVSEEKGFALDVDDITYHPLTNNIQLRVESLKMEDVGDELIAVFEGAEKFCKVYKTNNIFYVLLQEVKDITTVLFNSEIMAIEYAKKITETT